MAQESTTEGFSAELYKKFVQQSPDIFYICSFEGHLKEVNLAWTSVLGYSKTEVLGRSLFQFLHPEDQSSAMHGFQQLKEGSLPLTLINRFRLANDEYRWFKWKVFADIDSEIIFAISMDITEAELYSKMVSDIFTQAPCLAAVVEGPHHTFRFANEAYCQFMGQRDLVGKPVAEALPNLDPAILTILDSVYKTGEKFVAKDLSITADWHANGQVSEKFFTLVYSPIVNSMGTPTGIWTLAFDTTDQKRLENLVQITERVSALGRMAAGVAHEINNPLAYILGNLSLLNRKLSNSENHDWKSLAPELLKLVEKSEAGVLRIRDIAKSMNHLSNEGTTKTLESVSLRKVLEMTIEYAKNENCRNAQIILNVEDDLKVIATQGGLIQVFLNLLINACHAIQKGTSDENKITITAASESENRVTVKISDTGHGIPKQNLDRIFDPFFTSKLAGEGSGLGLSICYGIVQSLGGKISVASELGKGSEFTVELPSMNASM